MECSCKKCTKGCLERPGWFAPGEVEKAAEYMGMSVEAFFKKFLAVDFWVSETDPVFVLAPAISGEKAGTEYPINPYGRCVFYVDGEVDGRHVEGCRIHPVKPAECAFAHHTLSMEEMSENREKIKDAWKDRKKQIEHLLGRSPEQPPPDPLSVLAMLLGGIKRKLGDLEDGF